MSNFCYVKQPSATRLYTLFCPAIGQSIVDFFMLFFTLLPLPEFKVTSNTAPAHPHATWVAVCLAKKAKRGATDQPTEGWMDGHSKVQTVESHSRQTDEPMDTAFCRVPQQVTKNRRPILPLVTYFTPLYPVYVYVRECVSICLPLFCVFVRQRQ